MITLNRLLFSDPKSKSIALKGATKASGLYGLFFKEVPSCVPTDGCVVKDGLTLLYVGQSEANLRRRIRKHYRGDASRSTVRFSVGVLLTKQSGFPLCIGSDKRITFTKNGEQWLNDWMEKNVFFSLAEHDRPKEEESKMFENVDLPLNIEDNPRNLFVEKLQTMRDDARKQARENAKTI